MNDVLRCLGVLTGLASTLLALAAAAPAALASPPPPDPGPPGEVPTPAVHTVVTGTMPDWQITLIATGAAVVAAAVAVLLVHTLTRQTAGEKAEMGYPAVTPRSKHALTIRPSSHLLVILVVVLVDQATKAVQPAGTFFVNTGGWSIFPSALGNALWNSHTFGAVCDTADTVLLLLGLRTAGKLTNTRQRTATTALLAGLLSNLIDRLGGASLFHAGLPRGAIDWIPVPAWATATTINIADIVIVLAALSLAYHPVRQVTHALRAFARSRAARLAAAAAGLIAVAIWTTAWQANRHNAEKQPTAPAKTTEIHTAATYLSGGMDWV